MYRRLLISTCCALAVTFIAPVLAADNTINLNAPNLLGKLKLDAKQLQKIKDTIQETLKTDIIDDVFQCGKVRMDCEVRIARKWDYNGDQFREVVVNIHTVGNASITMRNHDGKWPVISVN